ncbi:MAG TPA: DUF4129 domain-containing protein [Terriglobales bacterium]
MYSSKFESVGVVTRKSGRSIQCAEYRRSDPDERATGHCWCGFSLAFVIAAAVLVLTGARALARASAISLDEYRRQLADISERVDSLRDHPEDAGAVESSIPEEITVRTPAGEVSVNNHDLKADLAEFSKADSQKRALQLPQIGDYVHTLSQNASSFERRPPAAAHDKLDAILAQREFRSLEGPNPKDVLLARLFGWLIRLLNRLGAGSAGFNYFQVVIYTIIAGALTVMLVWTLRRLRGRRQEDSPREIIPFAPSARSWQVWLAQAQTLAQQQDWRNAIHMAYWAGISFLEEHGAWKPNLARTPREYLRLVRTGNPKYSALAALTRQLERVWYGYNHTQESDFNEALALLEKLGCR